MAGTGLAPVTVCFARCGALSPSSFEEGNHAKENSMKKLLTLSLFTAVLLLMPVNQAQACMGCPCGAILGWCLPCIPDYVTADGSKADITDPIEITFPERGRALIKMPGYLTTHLQIGQQCVVGFPPSDGVEKINSVINFNSRLQKPFEEVTFTADEAAGLAVADYMSATFDIGNGERWSALVSSITGDVVDGVPNHFVIDVSLKEGVSEHDFVTILMKEGIFLTAASQDGVPHGGEDGGHVFLKRFSDYQMIVKYSPVEPSTKPSLSFP
jgi:hypothetical protein